MNLLELRSLIIDSSIDDWHRVATGPFFADAPDVDEDTVEQHDDLLVYRHDIDLTIRSGLRARGYVGVKKATELWHNAHFADPSIRIEFVDVFWRGVLVDRENVVAVDGRRATIPFGSRDATNYTPGEPTPDKCDFRYSATTWQTALARLVDGDQGWSDYMKQIGLVIE